MITARVMVVEDERVVALHLKQQLSRLGYEVPAMVTSGEQALRQIREVRPDVLLMDIHIEGAWDGIETVTRIPPEFHTPVIYLTAYSDEPTLERARATKPYGYLLKPFSERELHASIQMVLERRRADVALQKSERHFEKLVEERTASLLAANRALETETAERLKAEQALHHAQKMEAVGQLTGGIAHDFNNILTIILGNLELVSRSGAIAAAELRRPLDTACRAAERAATLTNRLLAFARRQPLEPKPLHLNAVVVGSADMFRRTLGEIITVETLLDDDLGWVSVDENQIENSLLNLAVNARDAMPHGGRLTIETANIVQAPGTPDEGEPLAAGAYVMVAMRDTGIGMSRSLLSRVFEPFFTTKGIGHGTGLGLSQVYGFVKQSGGFVKIHSELDQGTSVALYLPRITPTSIPVIASGAADEMSGKQNEIILVVEDDEDVRVYTAGVLRDLGYRVVEASDGPEALSKLEATPNICLLFTDVGLPGGLNGRELAEAMLCRRADLRVLFTTGYSWNVAFEGGQSTKHRLLAKPFTYAGLAKKIREALDGA